MYKYVSLIILDIGLSIVPAYAAKHPTWTTSECNAGKGGEIVEVGGESFCKASATMNWWSAYSWCQGIGGRLPSIRELCPNVASMTQTASCGYQYPGNGPWSSTPVSAVHQACGI